MTTPSFRGFVEFLEADPSHELNFSSITSCALACYAQHVFNDPSARGGVFTVHDGDARSYHVMPINVGFDSGWHAAPTYGEAAAILRPYLEREEAV